MRAEGLPQRRYFDGVSERRARAVRLHVSDLVGTQPGHCQSLGDDGGLPLDAGSRVADLRRPIVVDGRAADDGQDAIPVRERFLEALEDDDGQAAAAYRATSL